jgi:hypothetical protein
MVASGMAERRSSGRSQSSDSGNSEPEERKPEDRSDSPDSGNSEPDRITGTAPSGADISKLEKFEPSEEAKRKEPSKVDAMGEDKRRQVVGHSYGPSKRSQVMFFVAVAAILVVVVGGWLALVAAFDKPPEKFSERAPWSTTASDPELAAEQNAKPVSPLSPCGEPGNEYPIPDQSPCAPPNKANNFQGSSTGQ